MKAPFSVTIARLGSHKTVRMAADELKKYLNLMDPLALVDVRIYDKYDASIPNLLWVGLDDELDKKLKPVEDKNLDDAICIEVSNFCGFITGANERAVLISAYRFLKELGVKWLSPGKIGEVIPKRMLDTCQIHINEVPNYRHRCVCIEGATSYEHLYDLIDWLPKAGMNGYRMQFFNPHCFFNRWYSHERNEHLGNVPFTTEDSIATNKKATEDITDRSLLFQAVGHGWTADPFGIKVGGWYKVDDSEIPDELRECFAMRDGKRGFFNGSPLDTQLCYSNKKVISTISNAVSDYAQEHPEVDYIGVTLADQRNNFCECEECKKSHPTDLYINVINHVTAELKRRNLKNKITVDSYNETMWSPKNSTFNDPDRCLLLFAPITRSFDDSFADVDFDNLPEEWPFELNKVEMPRTNAPIIKLIKDWENIKVGDRYIFDYHFWGGTFICDVGSMKISRILSDDIKVLKNMNLNGYGSCQPQRYSFPNNFPMQIMADTLWDDTTDFDASAKEYMGMAYGKESDKVLDYLETLSTLTAYRLHYNEPDVMVDDKLRADNEKGLEIIAKYRPVFEKIFKNGDFENDVQKTFWNFLIKHLDLAELALKLQVRKFSGESPQERLDAIDEYADAMRESEPELHRVFDVWRQLLTLEHATPIEDAH